MYVATDRSSWLPCQLVSTEEPSHADDALRLMSRLVFRQSDPLQTEDALIHAGKILILSVFGPYPAQKVKVFV